MWRCITHMLQNQKFFVLFTFYIGLISYHRYSLWIHKLWGNWLLIKFQSISWRTSLHHLHTRRLEELHDLQVNIGQIKNSQKKSHPLLFQSPCHSGLYSFSFVWGRYQNNMIWNISGKKYAHLMILFQGLLFALFTSIMFGTQVRSMRWTVWSDIFITSLS